MVYLLKLVRSRETSHSCLRTASPIFNNIYFLKEHFGEREVYNTLKTNPFFRIRYKNVRSLKLKKYQYSLCFVVNENRNSVKIISCFHNNLNPEKQPRF